MANMLLLLQQSNIQQKHGLVSKSSQCVCCCGVGRCIWFFAELCWSKETLEKYRHLKGRKLHTFRNQTVVCSPPSVINTLFRQNMTSWAVGDDTFNGKKKRRASFFGMQIIVQTLAFKDHRLHRSVCERAERGGSGTDFSLRTFRPGKRMNKRLGMFPKNRIRRD